MNTLDLRYFAKTNPQVTKPGFDCTTVKYSDLHLTSRSEALHACTGAAGMPMQTEQYLDLLHGYRSLAYVMDAVKAHRACFIKKETAVKTNLAVQMATALTPEQKMTVARAIGYQCFDASADQSVSVAYKEAVVVMAPEGKVYINHSGVRTAFEPELDYGYTGQLLKAVQGCDLNIYTSPPPESSQMLVVSACVDAVSFYAVESHNVDTLSYHLCRIIVAQRSA